MSTCLFCNIPLERVINENELAYVIYDGFPVTDHHMLIIPKRHASNYFDLTEEEIAACNELLRACKSDIENTDKLVDGFNIGMNCGKSAGQTIFHCHTHLIPRRTGDLDNPKGGVRGVIPDKQQY